MKSQHIIIIFYDFRNIINFFLGYAGINEFVYIFENNSMDNVKIKAATMRAPIWSRNNNFGLIKEATTAIKTDIEDNASVR